MKLTLSVERWPYVMPFHITNYVFDNAEVVLVELQDGAARGWGEAAGVYYHDETPQSMVAQIEAVRPQLEAGIDRATLRDLLPPGGARNAVDAALWDLQAKRSGVPAWRTAAVQAPRPLRTTLTVGAGTPDQMAREARRFEGAKAIKLKITGEDPAGCVRAVRAARPDVWLGIDANQALNRESLDRALPAMIEAGVALIEQPVPVGRDADLAGLSSPIPIAADESAQRCEDLASLKGLYDVVNIKLDKCGGLTEGLAMAHEARKLGFKVMVGCMSGTSLSIAPAFILAQMCDFVDLDGPVYLRSDRKTPAVYENGTVWCPETLWGAAA